MAVARPVRWPLGAKLSLIGVPFLLLGLLVTTLTLWVSWQLDGGAAAVNEAGRMRMQVYRMAWLSERGDGEALRAQERSFDASLALLRAGDPDRPLVMPWDDQVRARMAAVEKGWASYRGQWAPTQAGALPAPANPAATLALISQIETLVAAVEAHLSRFTALTHLLQIGLLASGVVGTAVFVLAGYRFVLEPVGALAQAIGDVREGDLGVRVAVPSRDEIGALAEGFNDMADQLQASYQHLEARVHEKTAQLSDQRERLQVLYEVSTLVTHIATAPELARGFVAQVRRALRADAAALRLADEGTERFVLLAAEGLPEALADEEQCIRRGDCHCGVAPGQDGARVIPIRPAAGGEEDAGERLPCHDRDWSVVVTVPIRLKDRLLGELDLFFHARRNLADPERTLLDALTGHLAIGLENLRVAALEKEAAVAEERGFLARELHDSIAQSLAFLKIQVTLMRDAMERGDREQMAAVLAEIDLGVRESHGDVRELLMHFRTRTNAEDIEPALRTTLRKFEHQTGIPAELAMHGQGLPLPPDVQVQALHIVQEALSNVRKHAGANRVWVTAWRQPAWRFEVRDDGRGFKPQAPGVAETHVGLRIMAERAQRLGAGFSVDSSPGAGTRVLLTLPAGTALGSPAPVPAPAPAPASENQPAEPTLT